MLEYETANPGQDMDEKENRTFHPEQTGESSVAGFPSAEAPIVPNHPTESLSAFTDGNCSTTNIQPIPDRSSSSSGGQINQPSVMKGNREVSGSPLRPRAESFGRIYIDGSSAYQHASDVEAARQVPRTAGRS